eukprot:m.107864 g.107864  ORF g.107864 m.107864 type:complete len:56 (+) comp21181_c0_seq1:613-780(+)
MLSSCDSVTIRRNIHHCDTHEVLLPTSSCSVGVTRLIQPRTHATTTATIGCGAQR